MSHNYTFKVIVDRNLSPERRISFIAKSKEALQEMASMLLDKGPEKVYSNYGEISEPFLEGQNPTDKEFESDTIDKNNIDVAILEEGEHDWNVADVMLIVTSTKEIYTAEDYLVKDYFGWGN